MGREATHAFSYGSDLVDVSQHMVELLHVSNAEAQAAVVSTRSLIESSRDALAAAETMLQDWCRFSGTAPRVG